MYGYRQHLTSEIVFFLSAVLECMELWLEHNLDEWNILILPQVMNHEEYKTLKTYQLSCPDQLLSHLKMKQNIVIWVLQA